MNTLTVERLEGLTLLEGGHDSRDSGVCIMEAVAWFAGEKHSDHPACVSPVISAFLRRWNDDLDDAGRQRLKRFVPLVVGTATTQADEEARAWLVTDWMVRTMTPAWLDLAGVKESAAALRALPELTSATIATKAQPTIDAARKESAAARDAAGAAARDAALAAARDAAWAAARDAARDAAGDAAWAAAWDAAGAAAWAAAWAAAGAAAWAAAWDAAGAAAWAAAGAAARAAAKKKLEPTVVELQASAEQLLERMIAVGKKAA